MRLESLVFKVDDESLHAAYVAKRLLIFNDFDALFTQLWKLVDNRAWKYLKHNFLGKHYV